MKIHFLNCSTMAPRGAKQFLPAFVEVISLCALIESDEGLVLIDTGIGTMDVEDTGRLGFSNHLLNAVPDRDQPAVRQVARLGLDPGDVRSIICTHLDRDHAGGLPDFPDAEVHVLEIERNAAVDPANHRERERYRRCHFAHGPKWVTHVSISNEPWFGLDCIRDLKGLPAGIVLVPLAGHTRGHCGVAVRDGDGWLFHCGDAFYTPDELRGRNQAGYGVRAFRYMAHLDPAAAGLQLDRINSALETGCG
ncbi:MAG: MBL fold metallo-hydrolase, partial [Candidatus Geothermincolia bacterium]